MLTTKPDVQRLILAVAAAGASYHAIATTGTDGQERLPASTHLPEVSQNRPEWGSRQRPLLAVDLNRASEQELALLPGIGPVSASSIIENREQEGPFLRPTDLERVHGIGPKTVEAVRPYLLPLPEETERIAAVTHPREVVPPEPGIRQYGQ